MSFEFSKETGMVQLTSRDSNVGTGDSMSGRTRNQIAADVVEVVAGGRAVCLTGAGLTIKTRRRFLAEAAGAASAGVCLGAWLELSAGMETVLAADAGPSLKFPTAARERIAIASYPFRDFIAGRADKAGGGKMELKEFAAHVSAKFNIKKIEPWSAHFRSLEKAYLEELRTTVANAGRS